MLIAVTGASGFIGRYIVNHLIEQGHTCRCWSRRDSDRSGFNATNGQIDWLIGQLDDPSSMTQLVSGVDAVVHGALDHDGNWGRGLPDLAKFVRVNIGGSVRLIEAALDAGVAKFVFLSTCAVHDVILDDRALDETHPLWPKSHYGAHKAAIEKFVHSFGLGGDQPWDICALRPTGVYGCAQPIENSKWYSLIEQVAQGEPIDSQAGGKEVHAADVAKATALLLDAAPGVIAGQAYNCYDQYVSLQQVARIAKRLTNSPSTLADHEPSPKHQIQTGKIRELGMEFGGEALLEKTVAELVAAVAASG